MTVTAKKWLLAPYDSDLQVRLAEKLNISPLLAQLCINRGLVTEESINNFLHMKLEEIHDPFLFPQMAKGVQIIEESMSRQEKILIYGDYDVDGITATSLLYLYLKRMKADVSYYIPDRLEEGYGLNEQALQWASREGFNLIITVDCGISSKAEVEMARALGIKIIITDHHTPPAILPAADVIINPKIPGSPYPFHQLAGVGVAWKLAQALEMSYDQKTRDQDIVLPEYLDLVALGTLADVVPLMGENRVVVSLGLNKISESSRPGIQALLAITGLEHKEVTSGQVGFMLAPRLNAAGRLAQGSLGVKLLTTDELPTALILAQQLDEINGKRQAIEGEIFQEAEKMMADDMDLDKNLVVVLASENWHPGVIGIVASRLMEKYYRPVVLLSIDGETAKGSARSIDLLDMYQAFDYCRDDLIQFGGHKMAAGLKLKKENIELFRQRINQYAEQFLDKKDLMQPLKLDLELAAWGGEEGYLRDSESLAPYGSGNAQPVFAYRGLKVLEARGVGTDKNHLKISFSAGDYLLDGIGFQLAEHLSWIHPFTTVDVAASLERNQWNGQEKIQLMIKDIKPHLISQTKDSLLPLFRKAQGKKGWSDSWVDFRETDNREKYLIDLLKKGEPTLIYLASPQHLESISRIVAEFCPSVTFDRCFDIQRPWQQEYTMAKVKKKLPRRYFLREICMQKQRKFFIMLFFFTAPERSKIYSGL
ncbi:single-stranded-DNA-specific exonuclease RecJ [Dehalobacterium formicoaceticum]|uniref:single-stranded-DNA-specific exonuclease RecJ n=1 Tax=Dehalobacterium formicoaceticum TaxID=51515 RepID=UPI0012FC91C0|nr:single-stranded-DNA-specific exonuclease RecJ [Dehalobacterium formicoaceticum]